MRPLRDALSDESYAGSSARPTPRRSSPGCWTGFEKILQTCRATGETVQHVTRVCGRLGVGAALNLAVTGGTEMAFARYSTDGPGNSLYFVEEARAFPTR